MFLPRGRQPYLDKPTSHSPGDSCSTFSVVIHPVNQCLKDLMLHSVYLRNLTVLIFLLSPSWIVNRVSGAIPALQVCFPVENSGNSEIQTSAGMNECVRVTFTAYCFPHYLSFISGDFLYMRQGRGREEISHCHTVKYNLVIILVYNRE